MIRDFFFARGNQTSLACVFTPRTKMRRERAAHAIGHNVSALAVDRIDDVDAEPPHYRVVYRNRGGHHHQQRGVANAASDSFPILDSLLGAD